MGATQPPLFHSCRSSSGVINIRNSAVTPFQLRNLGLVSPEVAVVHGQQTSAKPQLYRVALLLTIFSALTASAQTITLLDPVPSLLSGPHVTTNVNALATRGRAVSGTAADGVTELVLRIPATAAGEQFTLTVINDQGQRSQSAAEDGGLGPA